MPSGQSVALLFAVSTFLIDKEAQAKFIKIR